MIDTTMTRYLLDRQLLAASAVFAAAYLAPAVGLASDYTSLGTEALFGCNDESCCPGSHAITSGSNSSDNIFVSGDNECAVGHQSDDGIYRIAVGSGAMIGGAGADNMSAAGFLNSQYLHGGPGNDNISGGGGPDLVIGGAGSDSIHSGPGNDLIYSEDTKIIASSVPVSNLVVAGAGDDTVFIGLGADSVHGGAGDDSFYLPTACDVSVELDIGVPSADVRANAARSKCAG